MNCPGAPGLESLFQDEDTEDAKKGTLAHAVAELKLRREYEGLTKHTYNTRLNKLKKDPLYDDEMESSTDIYVHAVKEQALQFDSAPLVLIEAKLDYSFASRSMTATA